MTSDAGREKLELVTDVVFYLTVPADVGLELERAPSLDGRVLTEEAARSAAARLDADTVMKVVEFVAASAEIGRLCVEISKRLTGRPERLRIGVATDSGREVVVDVAPQSDPEAIAERIERAVRPPGRVSDK